MRTPTVEVPSSFLLSASGIDTRLHVERTGDMMSFSAPQPVVSGQAHQVVSVDGAVPVALEQFVGEVSLTVRHGAESLQIHGQGSAHDEGVRFQEKDVDNGGKDVRVWRVAGADGAFTATAIGAF
jgi:hypothetical protein